MTLLEEEEMMMEDLGIEDQQQILIEVRNKDLTWPEEMSQLAKNKTNIDKKHQGKSSDSASDFQYRLVNFCLGKSHLLPLQGTGRYSGT